MSKRIAVKLTFQGEKSVRQGHPWVFSNSIVKLGENPETGDLAVIFSKSKNKIIGIGLYDADSPIRIKVLHSGTEKVTVNNQFFEKQIKLAFDVRLPLLRTNTNGYRLLFGENDGFPGLIADVYNDVAVLKLYSRIWVPYLDAITNNIINVTKAKCLVLRLSRNLQNYADLGLTDGEVIYGELQNETVVFIEHNIYFSANVIKGHKTGYFLDHRENRKLVGTMSKSKTVLDVFSYTGGFSVHALANGANEVTSIDISQKALEVASQNAKLNNYSGIHKTICGDAFKELNQLINKHKVFDVVVIDPPSFAKRQSEIELAKKKYKELAILGLKLTSKNGILILASCSSRVTSRSFFDINKGVLDKSGRSYNIINKTSHDIDHPITFTEAGYLKCGYYKLNG